MTMVARNGGSFICFCLGFGFLFVCFLNTQCKELLLTYCSEDLPACNYFKRN